MSKMCHSNQCSVTGICHTDCGMVHIKEPLLLIRHCSPSSDISRFSLYLSGVITLSLSLFLSLSLYLSIYTQSIGTGSSSKQVLKGLVVRCKATTSSSLLSLIWTGASSQIRLITVGKLLMFF